MAIHEMLTRIPKHELQLVGRSKATELVKVARKDGDGFDCATWLHKAKELPKEGFKCAVEGHLTGKETADAGNRQISRLLLGDDLRGFSCRRQSTRGQIVIAVEPEDDEG